MEKVITTTSTPSHLCWGIITAGIALSLALTIVLLQFGGAIGLSTDTPLREEMNLASWGVIVSVLWLLWTQIISSLVGGYFVGRLRTPSVYRTAYESELRDGIMGLTVWAGSTLLVFLGAAIGGAFAAYVALQTNNYEANEVLTNAEHNAAVIYAFAAGASSLVSAVVAWWAATVGGDHRDKGTDFSKGFSFRN